MVFTGYAEESAKVFMEFVVKQFGDRLKQERNAAREACCAIVYGHCGSDNIAQQTVDAIRAQVEA
jgi:hypothetical protein